MASGPLSVSLPTISTNPSSLVTATGAAGFNKRDPAVRGHFLRGVENFGDRFRQFRVHQRQRHFRQSQRRPLGRAVENAIGHALCAQLLMALFSEHPGDRVHHVRLAAAIRPHDARDSAAAERDRRLLEERFESQQLDFTQL